MVGVGMSSARAVRLVRVLAWALASLLPCACAPELSRPRVDRVEFGATLWSEGQRQAGVLFQDGGQAVPVEGGTLWLFGDTFLGDASADGPHRSDIAGSLGATVAFLPAGSVDLPPRLEYFAHADGRAADPLSLLPGESPDRHRLWPAGGVAVGARTYLYYSVIEKTGETGPWNFRGLGGGLAVSNGPMDSFARLQPGGDWRFPVEPIQVVREADTLYLLEVSSDPKGLILGRVAADRIEEPSAYEFLTEGGWSASRAGVKVILREAYGQVSAAWIPAKGRYLLATSSDFFHPLEIQLREARSLWGPWSEPCRIAVPDLPGKTTNLLYGTFLHPELGPGGPEPRLVATFCRVLAGDWEFTNPEWVMITLGR
jgi:hypothetical protein